MQRPSVLFPPLRAAVVALFALWCAAAGAQCGQPSELTGRPRVGLVLAGGGALGFSHIGVLRVIEELRVPVDCIAGTSIGALVGGAYASGRTPAELERLVLEAAWDDIFVDEAQRANRTYYRKELEKRGFWGLELGVDRSGVKAPIGVVQGRKLRPFFQEVVGYAVLESFDHLPIPFRAVATDVQNSAMAVLDRGDLARAMRASMAVPGAFAPEEIDGRLLVDGFVARNLPVDVVRAMGADVVIAVNLEFPPPSREQLQSVSSFIGEVIALVSRQNVAVQLATLDDTRDVLVRPDLRGFSSGSFRQGAELIKRGDAAARSMEGALSRLSLSPGAWRAYVAARGERAGPVQPPDEVVVDTSGLKRVDPGVVKDQMRPARGESLARTEVGPLADRLYGSGDYQFIDYQLLDTDGRRALAMRPVEKAWGPNYLNFGLQLYSTVGSDSESRFNLLGAYRATWLNHFGAEWRNEFSIGRSNRYVTEFYQPLFPHSALFVAPRAFVEQSRFDYAFDDQFLATYVLDRSGVGLDVGSELGRYGQLRVGYSRLRIRASPSVALPGFSEEIFHRNGARVQLSLDRLDNAFFPTQGYFFNLRGFDSLVITDGIPRYRTGEAVLTLPVAFDSHRFIAGLSAGSQLGTKSPLYEVFRLGGPFRFSGYQLDQLQGPEYWLARGIYHYRLPGVPIVAPSLIAGASVETGQVLGRFGVDDSARQLLSGSLFLATDTAIGPAYVSYGYARGGVWAVYFTLGFSYY
ncbi:MAG: patatin-like phospholipase family protein [Rhodocyclaceae bacterium]|nr:patatin-like phospholipase family protein [Rhodocyclaceae bacterium]MCA3146724.1 patatin-like phospholipase family protein [Rhodocyclaceae bacterium]